MKKLMITAAAVAMTAGAFAAPAVYDFKASVKHMYLKEVRVTVARAQFTVYQKYQKSASLRGYLIQDMDGLTSTVISGSAATATDFGRSRSFLVVQNTSAERAVRAPKVLPAVLDAKYLDTKFTAQNPATTGLAEGYLFVGGDQIAQVRFQQDMVGRVDAGGDPAVTDRAAANVGPVAATAVTSYADYLWTSVYLFGQYNGPNWFRTAAPATPFFGFEVAFDGAMTAANLQRAPDLQADGGMDITDPRDAASDFYNYYHDTWMNGSGVGKYFVPADTGNLCCGLRRTTYEKTLESLSGNLKGGIFICTENGIDADNPLYVFFDGDLHRWEDQFVAVRNTDAGGGCQFAGDAWKNDLWSDGPVDQTTTDVLYGTWSIKYNRNFLSETGSLARYRAAVLAGTAINPSANEVGEVVCAAAYTLNNGVRMIQPAVKADGTPNLNREIYHVQAANRFAVPFITPKFLAHYGL